MFKMKNNRNNNERNKRHIKNNNEYFEVNETFDERKNKKILKDIYNNDNDLLNMTQDNLESNLNTKIKETQKKNLKKVIKLNKNKNEKEKEKEKKKVKITDEKDKKKKEEKKTKSKEKEKEEKVEKEEKEEKEIDYFMNNNLDYM